MAIRTYKPTSPARRFMSVLTYEEIGHMNIPGFESGTQEGRSHFVL